jgi:hypothetical protein
MDMASVFAKQGHGAKRNRRQSCPSVQDEDHKFTYRRLVLSK